MNNEKLILKHGEYNFEISKHTFTKDELDALLAEHLAVNSSQRAAKLISKNQWKDVKFGSVRLEQNLPIDTILYTANPLNQELLDAVKSLHKVMGNLSKYPHDRKDEISLSQVRLVARETIASLSPNVTKLLESES